MPFSVPTFRYSSPGMIAGKLPMSPLRTSQEINLGGLKKGLGCGMGAFFGKREARIWKEDLKQRDEERGRTPGAQTRRIKELNIVDIQNIKHNENSHQLRLKKEHDKHSGGFGNLGATDDRLSVRNSALSGDVGNHSPRFLETFPTKPKQPTQELLDLRASDNLLLLGFQPLEPVVKENRSINYNPIVHKYIGEPRMKTDLQKRAKKERTGYVTIAGGRKDLAENMKSADALQSTMRGYIEYEHQKVDPVTTWLHDEQTEATGGLRTFPAQKGVSPLTRRLVQAHPDSRVKDWHVNDSQRAAKMEQIKDVRIAVNKEQRLNHEKKMALQLSTFKIKDPYSDHLWGINHERKAEPYRGYNAALQIHYHPEDEKNSRKAEFETAQVAREKRQASLRETRKEEEHNIVNHIHKKTGQKSGLVDIRPSKRLNKTFAAQDVKQASELFATIRHDHSLDEKENLYQSTGASYGSHLAIQRFGVASGTRNEGQLRYELGQTATHVESHANDESTNYKDKKWEHHGHEDAASRYGSGRVHVHGGSHANDESTNRDTKWEHHAHEDAASRYGSGRVHVHGGAHIQEESANKKLWNAGSDEKYEHMENRKTGVTFKHRKKDTAQNIGSGDHVTLAAQRKAQHRDSIAGNIASRNGNFELNAYAHHKPYGQAINPNDESADDVINGEEGTSTHHIREHADHSANLGEDFQRYDHKLHHHESYRHNEDESEFKNQYHASNLSGELNRFYQDRNQSQHHKAVGIDETTASHQIWQAMRSKGFEKVEQRTSAPKAKVDTVPQSCKA
jgi:hypothetical protein